MSLCAERDGGVTSDSGRRYAFVRPLAIAGQARSALARVVHRVIIP